MSKVVWIIVLLCLFHVDSVSKDIKYEVRPRSSAIVIVQMAIDSSGNEAILAATNIFYNDRFYPLANANKFAYTKDLFVIDTTLEISLFDPIFSIIDTVDINIMDAKLFADYLIISPDTQYIFGGEVYTKEGESKCVNLSGYSCFYIAFEIKADLLFVWENTETGFSMYDWCCSNSYKYTNGSSSPTAFLTKIDYEKKLTKSQQRKFNLKKLKKFKYDFYFCE